MSAASDIRYNSELMQVKKQENGHCVFNLFIFNYRGERKKTLTIRSHHFYSLYLQLGPRSFE